MKEFFEKNKIFIAIIIAAFIVGGFIWLVNKSPSCVTGEWTNDICGGGTCEATLMHQVRTVTPAGCIPESQCIEDPICTTSPVVIVTKVIDGDTVVVEGGDHVRLLGIDADEKEYPCYEEAKNRLEELILGKTVTLEKDQTDKDQYNRLLRWIFLDNQNINLQLVKEGQVICRFYEPDIKYKEECGAFEKEAKDKELCCKWCPTCECGSWINNTCGGGSCEDKLMHQTRICSPKNCDSESRCIENPICIPSSCSYKNLTSEKTSLEVVKAEDAGNYYGQEKIVEGYVASTRRYSNPAIFINFCKPYPSHCFVSIVWNSDWYKFPSNAAELYYNKTVRVMGEIKEYSGKPEIILYEPSQIEVCQ